MDQALGLVLTLVVGFGGVFLGARLTAARSHREFIRERTAQAYAIILEAIFDLQSWFSSKMDDHLESKEVDPETDKARREAYRAAKDRLDRTLAREEWLLSDDVLKVFAEMREAFNARYESWFDDLDGSWAAAEKARKKIIALARKDLGRPLSK